MRAAFLASLASTSACKSMPVIPARPSRPIAASASSSPIFAPPLRHSWNASAISACSRQNSSGILVVLNLFASLFSQVSSCPDRISISPPPSFRPRHNGRSSATSSPFPRRVLPTRSRVEITGNGWHRSFGKLEIKPNGRWCYGPAARAGLLAGAGEHEGDVVLAVLVHQLGDRLAGAVEGAAWLGQRGTQRGAERGQAVVDGPGAAFHQAVGVQREGGSGDESELGDLEGAGAQA